MLALAYILALIIGYLLGSINFSIVVTSVFYHEDVRKLGSGNAGMTNVLRNFGKKPAIITFVGDFLKGFVSVKISGLLFKKIVVLPPTSGVIDSFVWQIFKYDYTEAFKTAIFIAALGSVLGHIYPIYFKFKGGKGVSVSFGALAAATPLTMLISSMIFLVVTAISRIVSLGSMSGAFGYFAITILTFILKKYFSPSEFLAAIIFPTIIIYAHRSNIKRLVNGTEYKFVKHSKNEKKSNKS